MSEFIARQIFGAILVLILMAVWPGFTLWEFMVGWIGMEILRVVIRQEQRR